MFHGMKAFTPSEFCVLFESTCSAYIIAAASLTSSEATCETAYAAVAELDKKCRSAHVCNATAMAPATHCPHAQGWNTPTMQSGGPCM